MDEAQSQHYAHKGFAPEWDLIVPTKTCISRRNNPGLQSWVVVFYYIFNDKYCQSTTSGTSVSHTKATYIRNLNKKLAC